MHSVRQITTPIVLDTDDYVRPLGAVQPHRFQGTVEAKTMQQLIAFPVEVAGESYHRYEVVAKRAMRRWVDAKLQGACYGHRDADAFFALLPAAEDSAGRELTRDEIALLAFAIRDYLNAHDSLAKLVHRPGPRFAR